MSGIENIEAPNKAETSSGSGSSDRATNTQALAQLATGATGVTTTASSNNGK